MKGGKWIARIAGIGLLLAMARSKNTLVRGVGKAGGLMAAPRITRVLSRKT